MKLKATGAVLRCYTRYGVNRQRRIDTSLGSYPRQTATEKAKTGELAESMQRFFARRIHLWETYEELGTRCCMAVVEGRWGEPFSDNVNP